QPSIVRLALALVGRSLRMSNEEPSRPPAPSTQPTERLGAPLRPRQPIPAQPDLESLPPAPPPDDRAWGNPWAALVAGIVGLLLGALIGIAVGGKGKTVTQTQAGGQPALTRTVTQTQTQPTVEVRTKTVTTTSPASAESEARAREAGTNLRKAGRENGAHRRQAEGGAAP